MSLPVALGVYFIIWWLAFFIMLPIGVRALHEDEEAMAPGMADSAPVTPHLLRKALGATVLSALIFAAVYAVIAYRLIPMGPLPL